MPFLNKILLLALLSIACITSARAEKLIIAADPWCPFNCQSSSELPGFMVEVAQRIFAEHGHEVQYVEMNWARAIQEGRKGHINAIIGAFRGDAPDFVFPEQELALLGNTFFVHIDSEWRYTGLDSLKTVQLGAISGYDYGDELRGYIQESGSARITLLGGSDHPLKRGIQMLERQRIDVLVEADPVFWYIANRQGLKHHFKVAGRGSEQMKSYLAFSPALDSSRLYAKLLSDGISRLRASGELSDILLKYGLTDWRSSSSTQPQYNVQTVLK